MLASWLASHSPQERLFAALAISYLTAAGFYFSHRLSRPAQTAALFAASVIVLGAPLIIPAENRGLRLIGTLWSVTLWVKLVDLYVAPSRGPKRLVDWLIHLPSALSIVWRKLPEEPRYPLANELCRILFGGLAFALGLVIMQRVWNFYWLDEPFVVEHVTKVGVLFLTLTAGAYALGAGWRMAGLMARDAMDWPFLAATPAEFWRRYNRPAQQFLYEDIFKPLGGLRRPVRGTMLTFFISGLIHEYVFAIPIGAIQAYQMTFFMLHGAAVALTVRSKPSANWRPVGIVSTLAFTFATTVFFFASFNEIVEFYSPVFPLWLRDWTIFRW